MMDDHIINNNNNIEMMIKQQYYSFDEEQAQQQQEQEEMIDLPPGFRFHPTDLELICHYLLPKLREVSFDPAAVAEVDLNKVEPWDLPKKAKMGEKEWYFFCVRDRKYPTGMRTNRATESGYWKATGKDKEIHRGKSLVGMKKTLVFYTGRAPKGHKSGWVMHEYRSEVGNGGGEQHSLSLSSSSSDHRNLPKISKNDWVLCRIFNKDWNAKRMQIIPEQMITSTTTTSYFTGGDVGDNLLHHQQQKNHFLPPLTESSPMTTGYHTSEDDVLSGLNPSSNVTCISDEEDEDSRKGITQYHHQQQQQQMTNPSLFNSGSFQYQTGELYTEDPFFGQDQSILRLLMDGNGGDSAAAMSLGRSTGGVEHSVDPTSTTTTSVYGGDYGSYHHHYQNNNNYSSSINHDYGPNNIDVNSFLNY